MMRHPHPHPHPQGRSASSKIDRVNINTGEDLHVGGMLGPVAGMFGPGHSALFMMSAKSWLVSQPGRKV